MAIGMKISRPKYSPATMIAQNDQRRGERCTGPLGGIDAGRPQTHRRTLWAEPPVLLLTITDP